MEYRYTYNKHKYHDKVASDNAIYLTWIRNLDIVPIFARYVWLQLSVFDLSELGLGLLYNMLPIEFEPYMIDFEAVLPSIEEILQGIWMKFEEIKYEIEYEWLANWKDLLDENVESPYNEDLLKKMLEKGKYDITPIGKGYCDPIPQREFLRATFHKLRLLRTPDITWLSDMEDVTEVLKMTDITDEHTYNRIMLLFTAQKNAFVLGLSPLGVGRLTETKDGWGILPFIDYKQEVHEIKFYSLDQLQIGLILGITPLGYGALLVRRSVYKLPEGYKNPPIISIMDKKIRGTIRRLPLSAWAYSNYNKPEEMTNVHASDKTAQYDLLQTQRRQIEKWVETQIPSEERNAIKVRQYKNAVLQAICWRAKRHKWGFKSWKTMTEEEFKQWWLNHWGAQGLKIPVLNNLYEGMKRWISHIQAQKLKVGKLVKERRSQLALVA